MERFNQHKECLICESNRISTLKNYENTWLVKCRDCGFVFTKRIPTQKELIEHYGQYGRNDYLSPITVKRYHEILDFLEPYRKTNKLIDVGCGIGYFLQVAKERGWEVHGTEFTDEAISICENKGINMQKGVLKSENYNNGAFDVIVSFEVIEHINNPIEELKNFNSILRKEGALYITTPNFNSASRYYLKKQWTVIEYPEHLCYYTANTLNKVLVANGFKKKWIKTTGISMSRFQVAKDRKETIGEKPTTSLVGEDSPDEQLRDKMESNLLLKHAKNVINLGLNITRKGDSMKALFTKN